MRAKSNVIEGKKKRFSISRNYSSFVNAKNIKWWWGRGSGGERRDVMGVSERATKITRTDLEWLPV